MNVYYNRIHNTQYLYRLKEINVYGITAMMMLIYCKDIQKPIAIYTTHSKKIVEET